MFFRGEITTILLLFFPLPNLHLTSASPPLGSSPPPASSPGHAAWELALKPLPRRPGSLPPPSC
jgi:hypothetical protein